MNKSPANNYYTASMHSKANRSVSFGSKNCPIEPFTVNTKNGPIFVAEQSIQDSRAAAVFSTNCGIEAFPYWRQILSTKEKISEQVDCFQFTHYRCLNKKDGNSTILIGKDSQNKIRALFSMQSFENIHGINTALSDRKTGYIEECMIDSKYRSLGLGKILLEKLMETTKGHFTDVMLLSEDKASVFYKRNGFSDINLENSIIKKFSDCIFANQFVEEHSTILTKSLDSSHPWWKRIAIQLLNV